MIKAERRNPVYEALKAHRVLKLKIAREVEKEKKIQLIIALSKDYCVPIDFTDKTELESLSETGHHEGVIAYVKPSQIHSLRTIVGKMNNDFCLLLLEQVQYLILLDGKIDDAESQQIDEVEEVVRKIRELDIEEGEIVLGASRAYWEDLRLYDPVETAEDLDIPMLILQGERDYQVTMKDFHGWNNSLYSHENVELKVYTPLNHLFIEGQGKSVPGEYSQASNVAELVINDIAGWIENH